TVDLLYQPTSWEYVQFLYLANSRGNAFLANEGAYLLEAWLNTGMAAPYTLASAIWGTPLTPQPGGIIVDSLTTWSVNKSGSLVAQTGSFQQGVTVGIKARMVDSAGNPLSGAQAFLQVLNANGAVITPLQGFSDSSGYVVVKWKTAKTQATGLYSAKVTDAIKSGYQFNPNSGVTTVSFTIQ
ncbi:MAG TPA: hypothetical protein VLD57_13255, partial [Blastocatellia bacterium]|nr:hypothetical protein [Blastocatellia bacterium]